MKKPPSGSLRPSWTIKLPTGTAQVAEVMPGRVVLQASLIS